MVGDWTEVSDGVDQTFGVDITSLTEPKVYVAKWRTTWVNEGEFTVDGNAKEYYCSGSENVEIAPYIKASITSTVNYLCADNTTETSDNAETGVKAGSKSVALITAEATYGGGTSHFYKLYQVTSVETTYGSGVYSDVYTLVSSNGTAVEAVGADGKSTHTFTLTSGKPGRYMVRVYNGNTDAGTCDAQTSIVEITQPDDIRVTAKSIIADNGTNSGAIEINPIEVALPTITGGGLQRMTMPHLTFSIPLASSVLAMITQFRTSLSVMQRATVLPRSTSHFMFSTKRPAPSHRISVYGAMLFRSIRL